MPQGVGTPVPGGLRAQELVAAVTGIAGRTDPIAIKIAEINPLRDRDGKTTALIAEILAAALGD
ncbi:MAG: arginase family protein [Pseudomonadota bacterium]|nr:arginase family protein [Gammaproteobacteria bacterium]MDQ3582656.1 arginase family protein [Pseudomonadota bacterium]